MLLMLSLFSIVAFAQERIWQCGTDQKVEEALKNRPELQQQRAEFLKEAEEIERIGKYSGPKAALTVVPVVFHIIHNYGRENISREQVIDALRILNEDFQKLNADISEVIPEFAGIAADCQFEFRLARKSPDGSCTDGITRTISNLTFDADDNVKDLISWNTEHYLNIWVVNSISIEGAGGYAYLPGTAPERKYDGIVIMHSQLGSIGTSNGSNFSLRTLTHEVGHWLNLNHVWGSGSPGNRNNCNRDDGVADTPNCIGVDDQSCNTSQNTCGSGPLDKVDNVQNNMDYSSCALMFTQGQKNRMQAAANSSYRKNIWSAENHQRTGIAQPSGPCKPIADFIAVNTQACQGSQIEFNDLSYNAPVDASWSWNWSFPGGSPSSSASRNPSVTYNVPGTYSVSLTVTNSAGQSSSSREAYIQVNSSVPQLSSPIFEGFENPSFPDTDPSPDKVWRLSPPGNVMGRVAIQSSGSTAALRYRNANAPKGSTFSLVSPPIDFSNVNSPAYITFKIAYARKSDASTDRLEVVISKDCGRTWTTRYVKSGNDLKTAGNRESDFVPTAGEWREESINASSLIGVSKGLVMFRITDGDGNNIYLDDINLVSASPTGIKDVHGIKEAGLFPNPGDASTQLHFYVTRFTRANLSILDLAGRVLHEKRASYGTGEQQLELSEIGASELPAGIYMVRIETEYGSTQLRWLKDR